MLGILIFLGKSSFEGGKKFALERMHRMVSRDCLYTGYYNYLVAAEQVLMSGDPLDGVVEYLSIASTVMECFKLVQEGDLEGEGVRVISLDERVCAQTVRSVLEFIHANVALEREKLGGEVGIGHLYDAEKRQAVRRMKPLKRLVSQVTESFSLLCSWCGECLKYDSIK